MHHVTHQHTTTTQPQTKGCNIKQMYIIGNINKYKAQEKDGWVTVQKRLNMFYVFIQTYSLREVISPHCLDLTFNMNVYLNKIFVVF